MRRLVSNPITRGAFVTNKHEIQATIRRAASSKAQPKSHDANSDTKSTEHNDAAPRDQPKSQSKTTQQLDEELRSRLEKMSGSGGASGVQYENGRAEGMKREVKRNMFRII